MTNKQRGQLPYLDPCSSVYGLCVSIYGNPQSVYGAIQDYLQQSFTMGQINKLHFRLEKVALFNYQIMMKNLSWNKLYIAITICLLIGIPFLYKSEWNIHKEIYNIYDNLNINWTPRNEETIYDLCVQSNIAKMKTKVLAYTLYRSWAKDPKWAKFLGLLAKEALLSPLYKDWVLRLYHDEDFPTESKQYLSATYKNLQFCDIRTIPYYGDLSGMAAMEWRFLPIGDKTVDVMCSRDVDTPILEREVAAVQEWLESNKALHVMRDHPQHSYWPAMGGMFCFRNNKNKTLTKLVFDTIRNHNHRNKTYEPPKASDQVLLRNHVIPLIKKDEIMRHDSYHCTEFANALPFPSRRLTNSSGFMGCKRPCPRIVPECPLVCRPKNHQDWKYC